MISALIFGVIHLNPVQIVFGALYGLLLGWLTWRTGSLLPSIVVHVANNTTVMLMPASAEKVIVNMSLITEVLLAGGVASNGWIRGHVTEKLAKRRIRTWFAEARYSCDNPAGCAAYAVRHGEGDN